ncbi:MAG: hypothetical protein RBR24_08750, partial [Candidatus Carbobacillus sp.]|nr:hypothetical protein [Candidatus Carbobacillus sp.]
GIILFPIIIGLYFLFFCVMLYRSKEIVGYLTVVILVILGSLFGSGIWYDHTLPLVVSLLLAELHLTSGYLNQAKRNIIR